MKSRHDPIETPFLSAAVPIGFALLPFGILLWAVPMTGLGIV
jgi:hypothetical protein